MSQHEPTLEEPLSDDAAGEEEEEEDADALELKEVEESEQSGVADDHDLRVNTTRQAWLVKLPNFLAEAWGEVEKPDVELGSLSIKRDCRGNLVNAEIIVANDPQFKSIPSRYKLQLKNTDVKDIWAFGEDEEGRATEITAQVKHDAAAMVADATDPLYLRSLKSRTTDTADRMRAPKTRVLAEADRHEHYLAPSAGEKQYGGFNLEKKRNLKHEEKASRMTRDQLTMVLFKCFSQYEYWNLRGLVKYTHQPQAFVKEMLEYLCDHMKKGKYHGMYRLKDDYREEGVFDGSVHPDAAVDNRGSTSKKPTNSGASNGAGEEDDLGNLDLGDNLDEDEEGLGGGFDESTGINFDDA